MSYYTRANRVLDQKQSGGGEIKPTRKKSHHPISIFWKPPKWFTGIANRSIEGHCSFSGYGHTGVAGLVIKII